MNRPAHIQLATEQVDSDRWQLDLPNDLEAAAEYLRGIERARRLELDAIVRLRERIEGAGPRSIRVDFRVLGAVAALLVLLATLAAADLRGGSDAAASAGSRHAGHAAMGSGLAVTLEDGGPIATRTSADPGELTFILRNERETAASMEIVAHDGDVARTVATSPVVEPGQRVEWQANLERGGYRLHAIVEGEQGEPVVGSMLMVG